MTWHDLAPILRVCPKTPSRRPRPGLHSAPVRRRTSPAGPRMRSTFTATPADIEHKWFVVDAEGMVLGRLATEIARIIRGKHKPTFTPHMDTGDNVIVINAEKEIGRAHV